MSNAWDVPLAYQLLQPPQAREPARFDRAPEPPWLRATTERQAVVDAARVTAAAVGAPGTDEGRLRAAGIATEWAAEATMPAIVRYRNVKALNVRPGGAAVLSLTGAEEREVAGLIAAIYGRAARQLDEVGARKWAAVLWSGVEAMGGRVERAEAPSVLKAAKDTARDVDQVVRRGAAAAERAATGTGIGLGLGLVAVAVLFVAARRR